MFFFTFEGPDGGGKTTQIAGIEEWLQARGYDVVRVREPGSTSIGDQVRQILMRMENQALLPSAEFLLFSASRAQLVREQIMPALEAGKIVLSDRFFDSSLAYQGHGHGLPLQGLHYITSFVTNGLTPDLTFLLDLPIEEGLRRRQQAAASQGAEWNRLDAQTLAFHNRVRQGYHQLAAAEPQRWRQIDASRSPEVVQEDIRQHLDAYLREYE